MRASRAFTRPAFFTRFVFSIFLIAAAAFVFADKGEAQSALTADTIMGRWCGEKTAYAFTPEKLVVTFFDGTPQRTLRIKSIDAGNNRIQVHWTPDTNRYKDPNTVFADFTGNEMTQVAEDIGDKGPKRVFHRC